MKKRITLFNKYHILQMTFYLLLILTVSILSLFIVDYQLSKYIERAIHDRIELLNGKAEAIKVTLFSRTLKVKSFSWASTSDSTNLRQHSIRIGTLTASGINLYELLKNNTIIFDRMIIDSGKFQFDRSSKTIFTKPDDFESPVFKFTSIRLKSVKTQVTLDSLVSFSCTLNGELKEVYIEKSPTAAINYSLKSAEGTIEKMSMSRHEGMYGLTIARILFNTDEQNLIIDSVLVIPNYEKYEFAHKAGRQIGRLNLSVPRISINGINFQRMADSVWAASKVIIESFDLYSFKDKRVSDMPKIIKEMPMAFFLNLSYSIKVDTIVIDKGHIVVEEFPESGIESGIVTFDDLSGSITHLNNRIREGDIPYATLQAKALLMNQGRINATFQFPLDGSATYRAEGTVSRMPFAALNPLLKGLADIEVESGYLNNLIFNFNYTDYVSRGLLQVEYDDLHIVVLNKNEKSTNEFKTLLVNTFVKTNIDHKGTPIQNSAEIDIKRDRSKFIFNVWAKSVLDGLKNSMLKSFAKNSRQKKTENRRSKK
jgi:hypothetical protein